MILRFFAAATENYQDIEHYAVFGGSTLVLVKDGIIILMWVLLRAVFVFVFAFVGDGESMNVSLHTVDVRGTGRCGGVTVVQYIPAL